MRLIPFVLEDKTIVMINPERVDAIKTIGGKTRIFAGEFYEDVKAPVYEVCEILQSEYAPTKGKWEEIVRHRPYPDGSKYRKYRCSVCGNDVDDHQNTAFCPNCGADMR